MQLHVNQSIFGPDGDPLDYPGTRPDDAYYVDGSTAHTLEWDWDLANVRLGDGRSLTQLLAEAGEAGLEDRVVEDDARPAARRLEHQRV
jgi:hypothetical protein